MLKLYDNDRCPYERSVLKVARDEGIAVPELVETGERALLMEYVDGPLANDHLDLPDIEDVVLDIAGWLALFHSTFRFGEQVLIKSDVNFKNFITGDRLYGLDFELSRRGRAEEDIGEAVAYLLGTYPLFTEEKFDMSRSFMEQYEEEAGVLLSDIDTFVASSLRGEAQFRPSQHDILLKKADEILVSRPFSK